MYVFSNTQASALGLVPPDERRKSDMNFVTGTGARSEQARRSATGPTRRRRRREQQRPVRQGLPLIKPPYGRITAIDLNKGELVWQIAHGETPDNIRNHPALKGLTIPRTGRDGRIGTLVTKTLVIAGEGGFFTLPDGRRGAMLRAYDKATGKEVGAVYMPAPQTGSPMTYMLERQAVHCGRHRRGQTTVPNWSRTGSRSVLRLLLPIGLLLVLFTTAYVQRDAQAQAPAPSATRRAPARLCRRRSRPASTRQAGAGDHDQRRAGAWRDLEGRRAGVLALPHRRPTALPVRRRRPRAAARPARAHAAQGRH